MKAVTSRDNAAFKAMAKLAASTSERKRRGLTVLDGAHLVAAFLDSGREVDSLMVSAPALQRPEIERLVDRVPGSRVTVVSEALFKVLSTVDSATGMIAAAETPAGHSVPPDADLVLVLEGIQDPGNVGTLLRSAAAAGAGHAVLSKDCAFAWSLKTIRAAMGAHFALNIIEGIDLVAFLESFRGTAVALTGESKRSLYDVDLRGPVALLVGNEGSGLTPEVRGHATFTASIPMPGKMESLNAGVAGSLALFEAVRQRRSR
ncbi:23S rRNA (guanosine-2'-O-)-methyltransferase RlmB [Usitatibacter rugosus]|uniref:23S rRNA (Guanosine-2'-O-)-methyltransferase RlmB n=1 Tax=Usitatibacter rugosus TaxID=2732067 RepID=A0A6M4GU27_9PROT|nr:RNA methyltransferase [Usitatibacter rugosus]QJR09994.1 23S rRNA (guanosine-2'-O-)-methyltransferase RlmB [Usitatibacter rugosus]